MAQLIPFTALAKDIGYLHIAEATTGVIAGLNHMIMKRLLVITVKMSILNTDC